MMADFERWCAWFAAICVAVTLAVGCSKGDKEKMSKDSQVPPKGKNRLALEKSPYLLQHADNPVDWYPWGEEAFAKAKQDSKPIFLSIGYSTCHWCHVMEHESFEDSTVARLMNDAFVNIKVDREERPDIDNIYMTVCQMTSQSCGWPLNVVMTPDGEPFFTATYIPREARYGRTGMITLIPQLVEAWNTRQDAIGDFTRQVREQLEGYAGRPPGEEALSADVLDQAYTEFAGRFDDTHGGFGGAPKFPTPHTLLFLLRSWKRTGNERALQMVEHTLDRMAHGGIYDHVGFGFHRYSTDARWFAPHFEKMLYDQALLVMAYAEAYLATGKPFYRRIANEIIAYVTRDMRDAKGGFYSAEDADSENIEGKFYLWTEKELRNLLGDDADLVIDAYGVLDSGNFSEEVEGGNILYLRHPLEKIAADYGLGEQALRERIEKARRILFEAREARIHPHKDDKILTDWNGLVIAALAIAGRAFGEPEHTAVAREAAEFVLGKLRDGDGRLLHRYRGDSAAIAGNIDDYAFIIWGLLELYENTFDVGLLQTALDLNEQLITHYWDEERGGFYFSADDAEELMVRMKVVYDGAVPSGNSVAMRNLLRLGRITADPRLEDFADMIGRAFHEDVSRSPSAFAMLLLGLDFAVGPSYEVVIVGDAGAEDTRTMQRALNGAFVPNKIVLFKDTKSPGWISELAGYTASQQALDGKATAYVCRNYACELPTTDSGKMLEMLGRRAEP